MNVADLITVDTACAIIDSAAATQKIVRVKLPESAGEVLAEDVLADRDYPPFDKSLMDGYAVRSADARDGATLRVIGEIAAGASPTRPLRRGESAAVMTGAPLPAGADAVVPIEQTERTADSIRLRGPAAPGQFITPRGGDCPAGTLVLARGTSIGPAQLAVLATVGITRPAIFSRPTVHVLATGNEIVSVRSRPGRFRIRDANSVMLAHLLEQLGARVVGQTVVPDDRKRLRSALRGAASADILCITGGMSMGRYDFVPAVLTELGFELRITKLRIKPGKPFVFAARAGGKLAFGLPGNPLSAFVCAVRLTGRLIRRVRGLHPEPRWISAPLAEPIPPNGPREFYQPATWEGSSVRPLRWKGSADVFTLAAANALVVRPENDPPRQAGELVRFLEMPSC